MRINAVAPSLAMHAFLAKVTTDELLDELTQREAFGRAAEPWEIATVIAFLASDYSTYMTGEVVSVSSQRAVMPTTFATLDELRGAAGQHLGWTDWIDITQERVNLFADATGDHQWIHVDVERANGREPLRRADRPRLPHAGAVEPLPARAARGAGRVGGRELRHRQGALPEPGARSAAASAAGPRSPPSTRSPAACRPRSRSPSRWRARTSPPA